MLARLRTDMHNMTFGL